MSENSGFPFEGQELCTQEGKGRYPLHTPPLEPGKHAFSERLLSSESGHSAKPFEQSAFDPKRTFDKKYIHTPNRGFSSVHISF